MYSWEYEEEVASDRSGSMVSGKSVREKDWKARVDMSVELNRKYLHIVNKFVLYREHTKVGHLLSFPLPPWLSATPLFNLMYKPE